MGDPPSRKEREHADWLTTVDERIIKLEAENTRLSSMLGLLESHALGIGHVPKWYPKAKKGTPEAVANLLLSDLHLDERVNPHEVNGINAYDRDIATRRIKAWASNACGLARRFPHKWAGINLGINGDLVSGAIHADLRETNEASLPETLVYWAPQLAAAIAEIKEDYKVPMSIWVTTGNHGRLGEDVNTKGRGFASWDFLMCHFIKEVYFKNDDSITWEFCQGHHLFIPLPDGRYEFQTHGDSVHGGDGIAGVWSPLMKLYNRAVKLGASQGLNIAYVSNGHWHQRVSAHERGINGNSSLKGWDEYCASKMFPPDKPSQNFWIETKEHGTTITAPIFVSDRKAEGW